MLFFPEFLEAKYRQAYEWETTRETMWGHPHILLGRFFPVNNQERCPLDSGSKMGRVTTVRYAQSLLDKRDLISRRKHRNQKSKKNHCQNVILKPYLSWGRRNSHHPAPSSRPVSPNMGEVHWPQKTGLQGNPWRMLQSREREKVGKACEKLI